MGEEAVAEAVMVAEAGVAVGEIAETAEIAGKLAFQKQKRRL